MLLSNQFSTFSRSLAASLPLAWVNVVRAFLIGSGSFSLVLMNVRIASALKRGGNVELPPAAPLILSGAAMSIRASAKLRAGMYEGKVLAPGTYGLE